MDFSLNISLKRKYKMRARILTYCSSININYTERYIQLAEKASVHYLSHNVKISNWNGSLYVI